MSSKKKPKLFLKIEKKALTEYALTAFFLHPEYDKSSLNTNQNAIISKFLMKNLDNNGLLELDDFKLKRGKFLVLFTKQIKSPSTFWQIARPFFPILSGLALKLLNIPASSAQLERVFSNWGQIHSFKRNRLLFEKSEKLISVFLHLRNSIDDMDDIESDDDLDG